MRLLTFFHMLSQLDLGIVFWHGQGAIAEWRHFPIEDEARTDRHWDCMRMIAFQLCVQADAWKSFCDELQIDSDALLRDLPAFQSLQFTEETARLLAFSADEAVAYLQHLGPEPVELPAVEKATKAFRDIMDDHVSWWRVG